jgi:hypothetical protein
MMISYERFLGVSRRGRVGLVLAGWFLAGPIASAPASPLTKFEQFLAGGPAHWSTTRPMAVPSDVPLTQHQGKGHPSLREGLAAQYAMWQRDKNPAAFDRHHPVIGPMLASYEHEHATPFLWFATKANKAPTNQAEAIHADGASTNTSTGTATSADASTGTSTPHVALEVMPPSQTPVASPLLAEEGFNPPFTREISSSSVVTTNVPELEQQSLQESPAPVPEPSTMATALVLFAAAACWKARHLRGGRG